jgi:hypothetical protein
MERLSKNTIRKEVGGKTVYQVVVNGEKYQECLECEEYFKVTGYNSKYCPACAKRINNKKTAENGRIKYHAMKEAQRAEQELSQEDKSE